MRVMWLGTYERAYPRTRVLVEGLRALGAEVVEHHRPLWERQEHKAGGFLRPGPLLRAGLGYLAAWAVLPVAAARGPRPDVVVAGYPAQPDAVPAWGFPPRTLILSGSSCRRGGSMRDAPKSTGKSTPRRHTSAPFPHSRKRA